MKVVLQRVSSASVMVDGSITGQIDKGLLILLGVGLHDSEDDIDWLVRKITGLRIFSDNAGKMNHSVLDVKGSFLVVSQFTLQSSTKKGNRPSYINAARPEVADPMYQLFCSKLAVHASVQTGVFGADMKVSLTNDGPVTIILDSKVKE